MLRASERERFRLTIARASPLSSVVLGEAHFLTTPGPAHSPDWLTIPQRGSTPESRFLALSVRARLRPACIRTSTSFCDGVPRIKAESRGLVMEVKGDFCRQVRTILAKAGTREDYLEIGLNTGYCYNPLHNDLDRTPWRTHRESLQQFFANRQAGESSRSDDRRLPSAICPACRGR